MAILIATAPSLLPGIDVRLTTHTMENLAVVTSQETWLRLDAGEPDAWLVGSNDGEPRLEKPPMVTWLNLLAWSDLDPATTSPQALIHRARCVSIVMGMLLLAAVFLLASMLGDVRFAALATLVIASTIFFQRQARTASYDIHYVAWTALAVALGVWAIRPLHPDPSSIARRVAGWGGCALALTAAAMSKNPLPYLLALPALIASVAMLSPSGRRRSDALWLTASALLSAAPVAAWYLHVFTAWPALAERALGREIRQPRAEYPPPYYYVGLLGLIVPWSIWMIGGLIEPFRMIDPKRRRAGMLMVLWFGLIFVAMSIPAAKQQRYILGVLPSIGLLVAMFIRQHDERTAESPPRDDRLFRLLFAGLWCVLVLVTLTLPWVFTSPDMLMSMQGRVARDGDLPFAPLGWIPSIALAVLLMIVCAAGWRWHAVRPWRSSVAMAVWMLMVMPVYWRQEAREPSSRIEAFDAEAARIRSIVGDAPLRSLRTDRRDIARQLNEEFRIYYGRLIRRVWPDQIQDWIDACPAEAFVLAQPSPERSTILRAHGFEMIDQVQVDKNDREELWRWRRSGE